jgi:hypothetical protein
LALTAVSRSASESSRLPLAKPALDFLGHNVHCGQWLVGDVFCVHIIAWQFVKNARAILVL